MTGTVLDFSPAHYKKFAKDFVDKYERLGSFEAGLFAVKTLPKEKHPEARPYVTAEFKARGYTFKEEEEDVEC